MTGVTGNSQPVSYAAPTVAGDTAVDEILCTPASGSAFGLGATTVTCRGRDRLDREASCSFVVTLEPSVLGVKTFVAFGDSVTRGENGITGVGFTPLFVDTPNAYPTKLLGALTTDFPGQGVSVFNEGVSGEAVADGLARLPSVLASRRPGGLLLLEGYNDLLGRGQAASATVSSTLGSMVRLARTSGVPHVFVSTITPGRPGQRQINPAAIVSANALIRQMTVTEGAVLVDAYNAFVGQEAVLVENDGLHLTPAGNQLLAQLFYTTIRNRVPATVDAGILRSR